MKSLTEYLTMNIPSKMAFKNITSQVEEVVRKSGVKEGMVLCNSMHITHCADFSYTEVARIPACTSD